MFLDLDLEGLSLEAVEDLESVLEREGVDEEEEAPRARLSFVRKGMFGFVVGGLLKEEVVVVVLWVRGRVDGDLELEGRGERM